MFVFTPFPWLGLGYLYHILCIILNNNNNNNNNNNDNNKMEKFGYFTKC